MLFSEVQHHYDEFWNKNVFKAYETIIQLKERQNTGFFNNNNIDSLNLAIKHYCVSVLIILKDLNKNIPAFEDYERVQNYFTETITQALDDFKQFKNLKLDVQMREIIDGVVTRIDTLKNEFSYKIENRHIYSFNPSINYKPFTECKEDEFGTFFEQMNLKLN
ncbi:hypothetical protein ACQUW5_12670 [Legionella sp. CNM-1927-20]|uniref:hypothetical protein n=1 Tax=Legionella sp. CNM-1927-20 TaxID=3422221 RepID=UPI00403AE51B